MRCSKETDAAESRANRKNNFVPVFKQQDAICLFWCICWRVCIFSPFFHKPSSELSLTFSIRPGIRLLDGSVTDAMEATALTFNIHFIDIYVCSWGPRDDGAEMDGPKSLTAQALRLGTRKARLSSPSSHCCLSEGAQTCTLSVELRVEGQNVQC